MWERWFQCCHFCRFTWLPTGKPGIVLLAISVSLVKRWFDHNRWFIWALSCEWGCSISSNNDRGSQAPSFCPSGATNWPVWWVHVDYFTLFDFHHSWTSSSCYNLTSLNLSPLARLTLFFSTLPPSWVLPFYFFLVYFSFCICLVPLSSTPFFLLLFCFDHLQKMFFWGEVFFSVAVEIHYFCLLNSKWTNFDCFLLLLLLVMNKKFQFLMWTFSWTLNSSRMLCSSYSFLQSTDNQFFPHKNLFSFLVS